MHEYLEKKKQPRQNMAIASDSHTITPPRAERDWVIISDLPHLPAPLQTIRGQNPVYGWTTYGCEMCGNEDVVENCCGTAVNSYCQWEVAKASWKCCLMIFLC